MTLLPDFYKKHLKRELGRAKLQRRLSKTKKGSKNRANLRNKLALKHLKVSRQRKDFAVKTARCVVQSNDLVAYVDASLARVPLGLSGVPQARLEGAEYGKE
ncbi:transposase [Kalymmatonema gypsitolerans NIES-4073]|nr:transposase [Scytonema sp. NIES-4073]